MYLEAKARTFTVDKAIHSHIYEGKRVKITLLAESLNYDILYTKKMSKKWGYEDYINSLDKPFALEESLNSLFGAFGGLITLMGRKDD